MRQIESEVSQRGIVARDSVADREGGVVRVQRRSAASATGGVSVLSYGAIGRCRVVNCVFARVMGLPECCIRRVAIAGAGADVRAWMKAAETETINPTGRSVVVWWEKTGAERGP